MPIHVAITRRMLPGKEAEFTTALRTFLGTSFLHKGVQGAAMITALPGTDPMDIGILRTFEDEEAREAFYKSAAFREWEAYAATCTEPPVYRRLNGLEAFFQAPGAPPRWKMAVATLCGVFPTSIFLSFTIAPLLAKLPLLLRAFIIAALMVVLLAWVIMPLITKLLRAWLTRKQQL